MKVLWVDEDERIWAPERHILRGLGFEPVEIGDATSAFAAIQAVAHDEVGLLILDVMLLQGQDGSTFSDERTQAGLLTGIVLAQEIVKLDARWGQKTLFFSRATRPEHIAIIEATARDIGGYYLRKGQKTQGQYFIRWLRENGLI